MNNRPSEPRALRSQPTRDRILAVARACFAESGFDGTTIRTIAARAAVAPAMVMRYYGSKEGLFVAAVRIDLQLPDLRKAAPSDRGTMLVAHFLGRWEGEASDGQLQILLRASISHVGARDMLTRIFETQLCAAIAATGMSQPALRASLIASQMLGLALVRYVLRLLPLAQMDRQAVIVSIAPVIRTYLDADIAAKCSSID